MPDDGELTLVSEGQRLSGWQEIRVSRGIERCPSDFDIQFTARFPGEAEAAEIRAGAPCQVLIGGDVVVTGYVDRYAPEISPSSHVIRAVGRGKCQDLVDCSAYLRGAHKLKTAVANDLTARTANLAALVVVKTPAPLPSLVQAYRLYQDLERADQLAAYADAPDPLFLPPAFRALSR
jgi:prophage tail gpP-like protein